MTEDIAVEVYHAPLTAGLGKKVANVFCQAPAGVRNHQLHAGQASVHQVPQKRRSTSLVVLGTITNAQYFAVSFGIHRAGHQLRGVANSTCPSPLHHNPIQVQVWMRPINGTIAPLLDLRINGYS